jgi:ribosomal protein S18 acetylase RimI-like enzyme
VVSCDDEVMTLDIRAMTRDELKVLIGWAADEGWNPGFHDASIFWGTDPEAFIAAELDSRFIGGGSVVSYGGAFGFMGLFIVDPRHRGHGLGSQLWHARLERLRSRLEPGATIGMDGVFEMQDWYAGGGFVFHHRSIRYRSTGVSTVPARGVVAVADVPFEQLSAYDRSCFPAPRGGFLRPWLSQPGGHALAAIEDSTLAGFGVARRCREGIKIGPLFADHREAAEGLYASLAATAPGEPVFLDVPESNPAAMALAADLGMEEVFGTARMYIGTPPALHQDRIFGITTFELG